MDEGPSWKLDDVSASEMVFWADLLDDPNPIHSDPEAARRLGFGNRTVNPGPVNLAYVLNLIAQECGGTPPSRITARFLGNVMAGDDVTATLVEQTDNGGSAVLTRNGDEVVLQADFTMPGKPAS
ncbi:MaoC family dehydratase [Croceicoccus gelatinilyticus]|uniref:MaoC family dehydratase n=1 Tax=Croceicoccus gelatinilyticus TaxID=2835536 RepID=UPI001BCF0D3C|nr:MaoC family dehydratase [Croceicoccus gelatinilyticus]MBS7670099.1 MaoC family dehydratase [Croceicoccus gelatinilyticus]